MGCVLLEYIELPVDFYSIKKLPKSYQRVLFLYLKIEKSRDKLTVVNYDPATFIVFYFVGYCGDMALRTLYFF